MNMFHLLEPPKDSQRFITFESPDMTQESIEDLRRLLNHGDDLKIASCSFEAINQVKQTLIAQRYIVMFVRIPGMTGFAHFFLKRITQPQSVQHRETRE